MQDKHLTKSFGIRVPLNLYMQMLSLSVEHKISMTDICLSAIMNSSIIEGQLDFGKGGKVNAEALAEIEDLRQENKRLLGVINLKTNQIDSLQNGFNLHKKVIAEQGEKYKDLENQMVIRYDKIKELNVQIKNQAEQMIHWETYGHPKRDEYECIRKRR